MALQARLPRWGMTRFTGVRVLEVRIHLPPAESLQTFGSQSRRPADYRTRHAGYGTSPDFPGERLIVCRNRALAVERTRKREELLAATERELARIAAALHDNNTMYQLDPCRDRVMSDYIPYRDSRAMWDKDETSGEHGMSREGCPAGVGVCKGFSSGISRRRGGVSPVEGRAGIGIGIGFFAAPLILRPGGRRLAPFITRLRMSPMEHRPRMHRSLLLRAPSSSSHLLLLTP